LDWSPFDLPLTDPRHPFHLHHMELALAEAEIAAAEDEVPVGAELWKLLLVIALNKIRAAEAYHRAGKRDVGHTATANGLDESFAASGDDGNGAYLNLVVSEALERLPAQLREIVELRLQGYEVREIAEMTGRALRTVERLLKDARAKLGSFLGTAD